MALTPAETAETHTALTQAQGDRLTAAEALNLTVDALALRIAASPELTALWEGKANPVTVAAAYSRDKPVLMLDIEEEPAGSVQGGPTAREIDVATGLHDQEQKLRKFDWEGVGVKNPKTRALMQQFEAGVGRGVMRMMDTMQGGMAFCFAMVSQQFADVSEQLELEQAKTPDGTGNDKRDEQKIFMLHARFMDLAREMQKFNKEVTSAVHTRLLIAEKAKKLQQAGNKLRKPGWRRVEQDKGGPDATG